MARFLFLLVVLLLSFISVSFGGSFGTNTLVNYGYNSTTQIMTDSSGLQFSLGPEGVMKINDGRFLAFGMSGVINSQTVLRTSLDYNWSWSIETNGSDYIFTGQNNNKQLIWEQKYYFYENQTKPMKITNFVENNVSTSTDTVFYYLINSLQGDNIVVNNTAYHINDYIGLRRQGDLNKEFSEFNFNDEYDFLITDLITTGYNVIDFRIMDGSLFSRPNHNFTAIGFTKNSGFFPFGSSVLIDPSFTTNSVESPRVAVLDNNTFVVAWCDESEDDITFAVYQADGTVLKSATDVDTSIGSCDFDTVDVAAFNYSHIVITYIDKQEGDASYITGNWSTMNTVVFDSAGDADNSVGPGDSTSVAILNSSHYVHTWCDGSPDSIRLEVRDINGNQVGIQQEIQDSGTTQPAGTCDVDTFNESYYIVAYTMSLGTDISYMIQSVNITSGIFTNHTGQIDVDGDAGANSRTSVVILDKNEFAILWDDPSGVDTVNLIFNNISGVNNTPPIIVDSDIIAPDDVYLTRINDTHVAGVYRDRDATSSFLFSYSKLPLSKGTQVLAPVAYNSSTPAYHSIVSSTYNPSIGFCDNGLIISYGVSGVGGIWQSNYSSGLAWNGSCNSSGGDAIPLISYVFPTPTTATTLDADYIYINVSANDSSWIYGFTNFNNSLVGWWRMDNDSTVGENNNVIYDWSGNGNNGTVMGDTIHTTVGKFGGGFEFDGDADYIQMSDITANNALEGKAGISVSAWVKYNYDTPQNTINTIVSQGASNSEIFLMSMEDRSPDIFRFYLYNDVGVLVAADSDGSENYSSWNNIVGVYNGSNVLIYVDGVIQSDKPALTGLTASTTNQFRVGTDKNGAWGWDGSIDEVLIFNRSLSADEIEALYNASAPRFQYNYTNLSIGDYSFQSFVVDAIGNMNQTELRNVTLRNVTVDNNSCTYSGSGDWEVDCSDGCNIITNVNLLGNALNISGTGTFKTTARIFNFSSFTLKGDSATNRCTATCISGGCFG